MCIVIIVRGVQVYIHLYLERWLVVLLNLSPFYVVAPRILWSWLCFIWLLSLSPRKAMQSSWFFVLICCIINLWLMDWYEIPSSSRQTSPPTHQPYHIRPSWIFQTAGHNGITSFDGFFFSYDIKADRGLFAAVTRLRPSRSRWINCPNVPLIRLFSPYPPSSRRGGLLADV